MAPARLADCGLELPICNPNPIGASIGPAIGPTLATCAANPANPATPGWLLGVPRHFGFESGLIFEVPGVVFHRFSMDFLLTFRFQINFFNIEF